MKDRIKRLMFRFLETNPQGGRWELYCTNHCACLKTCPFKTQHTRERTHPDTHMYAQVRSRTLSIADKSINIPLRTTPATTHAVLGQYAFEKPGLFWTDLFWNVCGTGKPH